MALAFGLTQAKGAPPAPGADADEVRPWTRIVIHDGRLSGVAWSGDRFVAVGSDTLLSSEDGLAWKRHDVPGHAGLADVTWSVDQFVAVGNVEDESAPAILTSPDGEEWTDRPVPGEHSLIAVAASGDVLVAVGPDTILRSRDGIDWARVKLPEDGTLRSVIRGDGLFLAVGQRSGRDEGPLLLTSPDGETWTVREAPHEGVLWDVAWSGSRFVAVGKAAILTSFDAGTWTAATSPPAADLAAVTWGETRFAAVGRARGSSDHTIRPVALTSRDGTAWDPEPLQGEGSLLDVAWGAGRFVAVGWIEGKAGDDALVAVSPAPFGRLSDPPRQDVPPPPSAGRASTRPPAALPPPSPPPAPAAGPCPAPGRRDEVTQGVNWTVGWSTGQCFEIERVEGVEPRYKAGSVFTTRLFGRAITSDVVPEPKNGFCVQGYIDHASEGRSLDGANGRWDEALHAWVLEHHVPAAPRQGYGLEFFLYCCQDESVCAANYGRAAQTMMEFRFDAD
jgi:hypothetical protein